MPAIKNLLLLFAFLIVAPWDVYCQSYNFRHYQVEDGLSNNSVSSCIQDHKGFMWFGTKDGLNRFDGYAFKIFRNNASDSTSIGSNFITALFEDKNGTLWVGTGSGLYSYDAVNEIFHHFKSTLTSSIKEITQDPAGNLWFIKGRDLCKYNQAHNRYVVYKSSIYFNTTAVTVSVKGEVWVASDNGNIYRYNTANNSFTGFNMFSHSAPAISKGIEKIHALQNGNILIGTNYQGVKLFDNKTSVYNDLFQYNEDHTDIFVRNFTEIDSHTFWVGTESGIFIFNYDTGTLKHLSKTYNDPFSLSDNAVYSFCKDKEGGIWVTTYFGGINYYPKQYTPFNRYFPKPAENSLTGNVVREIHEDKYGFLWIGTDDAGLNKFNPTNNHFTSFLPGPGAERVAYSNIHGLLADNDDLWIGTFEHGINVMDIPSGKIIKHYLAGTGHSNLKSNFIYCMTRLKNGRIIIGTTNGAYQYDKATDSFSPLPHLPLREWYSFLLEDKHGIIWGVTYKNGINYYNQQTGDSGTYKHDPLNKKSLSSDRVNSVFEDSFGKLWFATENGLSKLNKATGEFSHYTEDNGLPSNFTLSILEDSERHLWISTTKGLARFDLLTDKIQVFKVVNGILNDQFNFNSAYKDHFGRMYFGSVKGMISFDPKSFIENKYIPPVYITSFKVSNKDFETDSLNARARRSIAYHKNITLNYDQSTFSIDFAALSYTAPQMAQYSYIMVGLDKSWTKLKENRTVYYTDLSPGTYTFKVKNINNPLGLKSRETTVTIEITPPWWKTNYAYLFYLLLFLGLVLLSFNYYYRSLREKNQRAYDLLQTIKEKETYQSKIDFFTNVAHEIKTPLSLIRGPLENINKKFGHIPELNENLEIMDRNTVRLIELASQLLDFRQTEAKAFALNYTDEKIPALLQKTFHSFKTLAEQKKLDYKLSLPATSFEAKLDYDAFNKILYNLFSNAIKYAEHKVSIKLFVIKKGDKHFRIEFKNDGMIIPSELSEKIFEPFFRLPASHTQGTGIGLAISSTLVQLHNGELFLKESADNRNTFCLIMPL